jgi:hypothetical protein
MWLASVFAATLYRSCDMAYRVEAKALPPVIFVSFHCACRFASNGFRKQRFHWACAHGNWRIAQCHRQWAGQ